MTKEVFKTMTAADTRKPDFINALPKVELHVHLEGTVTPLFWKHLLNKHQLQHPVPGLPDLEQRFRYKSFNDFLALFRDVIYSFKTPEDFYDLTRLFLQSAVEQNIRHCEVMLTPWFVVQQGIDYQELMAEIDRAAREVEATAAITMKLILDGPRNFGKEVVKEVFEMAARDKTGRVIGVGLGGDEKNYPAKWYADEFKYAQAEGLATVAHAGETAGEQSMLDAIMYLNPSRLGHCLGIPRSSRLEQLIFSRGITLDLCPWSNVATGVIDSIEKHPMYDYLRRGYPITLNSDDPGMFGNRLLKEYKTMADLHPVSIDQLGTLAKNAVNGAFLSNGRKLELAREIDRTCLLYRTS
jgi:adenosine deaminase